MRLKLPSEMISYLLCSFIPLGVETGTEANNTIEGDNNNTLPPI
jgi:hypothetical protein